MVGDEPDQLRRRTFEPGSSLLHIRPARIDYIERLGKQRRKICMLYAAHYPLLDTPGSPEFGSNITCGDIDPDSHREFEPKSADRDGLVFLGQSSLAGLSINPTREMLDGDMRLDLVAMLPAGTRCSAARDLAYFEERFFVKRSRMNRAINRLIELVEEIFGHQHAAVGTAESE